MFAWVLTVFTGRVVLTVFKEEGMLTVSVGRVDIDSFYEESGRYQYLWRKGVLTVFTE